jgi:hypothetical protein
VDAFNKKKHFSWLLGEINLTAFFDCSFYSSRRNREIASFQKEIFIFLYQHFWFLDENINRNFYFLSRQDWRLSPRHLASNFRMFLKRNERLGI